MVKALPTGPSRSATLSPRVEGLRRSLLRKSRYDEVVEHEFRADHLYGSDAVCCACMHEGIDQLDASGDLLGGLQERYMPLQHMPLELLIFNARMVSAACTYLTLVPQPSAAATKVGAMPAR